MRKETVKKIKEISRRNPAPKTQVVTPKRKRKPKHEKNEIRALIQHDV